MKDVIGKLQEIKEDVDAIYHHQSDRVVKEINEVIEQLREAGVPDVPAYSLFCR